MKNNIDIIKYTQLVTFQKRRSEGYILTKLEINKFLHETDDQCDLMMKVIYIYMLEFLVHAPEKNLQT